MMPNMMSGMGAYALFWIVIAILLSLLLVGACILLLTGWLRNQRPSTMQNTPQPLDSYQEYEQGYQPQQQPPETNQEGEQRNPYPQPQYEQPQVQHSQMLSSEH